MVIQWLGHASFLIISANGTKIITDPYEPGAFGGGISYRRIEIPPDIVTVSHDHADHGYVEGLPNHFSVVSHAGVHNVKGIEFKGVDSYHDPELGSLRGRNTIFVMNIDHVRVCHLGDLGHVLTPHEVDQVGFVDILLIPVGGYYTIGPAEATRVVEQLSPKVVIPMHYKTDKCDFPIVPADEFLLGKPNVTQPGSSEYEVTKDQLPDQQEVVVLQHAL
jgi:L-ascorbate metabolism protein UlaG (beta-lactamase superfamily)